MSKPGAPTIKTLMSPFPYHIHPQASLTEAQKLMQEKNIHHLVVILDNSAYGLLSERDLQHHQALYGNTTRNGELMVGDICAEQAVCADINDPLERVLEAMAERHLGSVVILREGELAGIFTTTDACKAFARHLREQYSSTDNPDLIA